MKELIEVPVNPDDTMIAAGMESDAIQHPWQALDVYRMMIAARCTQSDHRTERGPYRVCRRCGGEY